MDQNKRLVILITKLVLVNIQGSLINNIKRVQEKIIYNNLVSSGSNTVSVYKFKELIIRRNRKLIFILK